MPQVWIVIVGYRNPEEVVQCVASLQLQSHSDWGVVVCENGGDAAFETLKEHFAGGTSLPCPAEITFALGVDTRGEQPVVLLHAERNLGYAGAINACLAAIDGGWEWVWVLNPDTQPDARALEALVTKAGCAQYGIVGSRLVYRNSRLIQAYGGTWQQLTARGQSLGRSQPAEQFVDETAIEDQMDYVLGASMLVSRRYVDAIGRMDDRYFLYCEEVDWCLRRQSFRLGYAHASIVYHTQGTTIGSQGTPQTRSRLAVYLDERNRLLIARRFFGAKYPLTVIVTLLCLSRYLREGLDRNFLVACEGWWAGLCGRSGPPRGGYIGSSISSLCLTFIPSLLRLSTKTRMLT